LAAATVSAQEAPSYAKMVRPLLVKYCVECHNSKVQKGGLDLETHKAAMIGSDGGAVIVPGKPDDSRLQVLLEGKDAPKMPPPKYAHQPKAAEIQLVRAWIRAGAKDDSAAFKVEIPDIKPKHAGPKAITALRYSRSDQALLAVCADVWRSIDIADGDKPRFMPSPVGKVGDGHTVTALAFGPAGVYTAFGSPGQGGFLASPQSAAPVRVHEDVILDLAIDSAGQRLATASYDTRIRILDRELNVLHALKEHSDAVYGVAFSPDGKRLASVSADRALKVWDVESGKLLFTLGEATDWLYAVAWSADGTHLVAGGVDKSIRVYRMAEQGAKIAHSVFAHEGPVLKLAFAHNNKTLYSLGQDRIVKAWDVRTMTEEVVFEKMPEAGLHLAVLDKTGLLAVGRYDGVVQLFDKKSGKSVKQVKLAAGAAPKVDAMPTSLQPPAKIAAPLLKSVVPAEVRRGQATRLVLEGEHLAQVTDLRLDAAAAKITILSQESKKLEAEIAVENSVHAGIYKLSAANKTGSSAPLDVIVDLFPLVKEAGSNESPGRAQRITPPATLLGKLDKAGDADFYALTMRAGESIGAHIIPAVGSKMEPVLTLSDSAGRVLAESSRGFLGHTFDQAGTYVLGVRDQELRGGASFGYRLNVGAIPIVTWSFPLGGQRGSLAKVRVRGVFLGKSDLEVDVPVPSVEIGSMVAVPLPTTPPPLGAPKLVVGEFPDHLFEPPSKAGPRAMTIPGTLNGFVAAETACTISARKGERLLLEVQARRLGSPLDSVLEILDAKGNLVPRALLRCQAKTYVTFRDHDSVTPKIRLEHWSELGVNDLLYVDGELIKIKNLPGHPDADCDFFAARGQRLTYLDTTPTHHAMNVPMYKVSVHPPGTTFPPNGFPVFALGYRNDDGGPGFGRDSRLVFDPPADGTYHVRVRDANSRTGPEYAYRLTVRPPRPGFKVSFSPTSPTVARGSGVPITITLDRLDDYQGPVALRWRNVPAGLTLPSTTIGPEDTSTAVTLYADHDAALSGKQSPLTLIGEANIEGRSVTHEAMGKSITVENPGELIAFTDVTELALKPGGVTKVTVHIERRQGFLGRVPLDVRGLPHGVKVLDLGLNGILVTERETRRTISLYAEPWVAPTDHPIVLLARREGKNTEHATKPVRLRIGAK
jgi:hypothetical protein